MQDQIILRDIHKADCLDISEQFAAQGWHKPASQYLNYLDLQTTGERDIILAELNGQFAGYLTVKWTSDYLPFKSKQIPEIVDFNVLKKYQRRGIGTQLMDEAESRIRQVSAYAGIGFGIYQDYGAAQILYAKRGYIPDGKGLVRDSKPLAYGDQIIIDDDVVMYLTKQL